MDFTRILFEYITLARQFEGLAPEAGLKVVELIQIFNSLVADEILGGAAFQKKKIKHITSKHLGKFTLFLSNLDLLLHSLGIELHLFRNR